MLAYLSVNCTAAVSASMTAASQPDADVNGVDGDNGGDGAGNGGDAGGNGGQPGGTGDAVSSCDAVADDEGFDAASDSNNHSTVVIKMTNTLQCHSNRPGAARAFSRWCVI